MTTKVLFGFHAVTVRLKTAAPSITEIHVDSTRRDARMRQFVDRARDAGVRLLDSDDERLTRLAGSPRHQGVVARVSALKLPHSVDSVLEAVQVEGRGPALLLVLDGVTDPHNLGACLRGLNATVAKVASGAAETMPYLMVTNLARSLGDMKDHGLRIIGTSDDAEATLYEVDLSGPVALVLGAEGAGLRQLTRKTCDQLVRVPMAGAVESLNVSVAAGVCLYEALRQRSR